MTTPLIEFPMAVTLTIVQLPSRMQPNDPDFSFISNGSLGLVYVPSNSLQHPALRYLRANNLVSHHLPPSSDGSVPPALMLRNSHHQWTIGVSSGKQRSTGESDSSVPEYSLLAVT